MALQGTLDTFELPDVLRLLASTKKTGRLLLTGDRGDGSVWLADGQVTGVQTPASPDGDAADGLFDLLRAREGGFAFEPGLAPESTGPAVDVEPLLVATEQRLADWREIEAVVPSVHAWVALVPELPEGEVTVDADTWRLVATIGSGLTVADLGRDLGLAEVPVCRVVRDLVVLGLGAVTDASEPDLAPAPAPVPAATWEPTVADPAPLLNGHADDSRYQPSYEASYDQRPAAASSYADLPSFSIDPPAAAPASPVWDDAVPVAEPETPVFAVEEPLGYGRTAEPMPEPEAAPEPEPAAPMADPYAEDDADEVVRQLAMLSPRAAQAVAAAAAADSDDERDAHLDALDEGDEPINRGLLLKFLSSVKS